MKKTIRLTEKDLTKLIKRIVNEDEDYKDRSMYDPNYGDDDNQYDYYENQIEDGELKKIYSKIYENVIKLARVSKKLHSEIESNASLDEEEKEELIGFIDFYVDLSEDLKEILYIDDNMEMDY